MPRYLLTLCRRPGTLLASSLLLLAAIGGCTSDVSSTGDANGVAATLRDFVASFARNIAAAWLL